MENSRKRAWIPAVLAAALAVAACGPKAGPPSPRPVTQASSAEVARGGTDIQIGVASFYGRGFAGKPTASGERFDPEALTCAHRTLPFGTWIRVTNLGNGRSVVVRVNDRGPFTRRRVLDVSEGAARQLDMIASGTAHVRIEVVPPTASR